MKENTREDDFKDVKKQRIILRRIMQILIICLCFVFLGLWEANNKKNQMAGTMCFVGFVLIYVSLIICYFVIDQKVYKKLVKIQKDKIIEMAREGNLKKSFRLKDETITQKILFTQIKQIIFRDCTKKELKAEVLFGNNNLLYPICFPKDKILSLINEESENRILENVIDSIALDGLEDEMIRINIKLVDGDTIPVGCCYDQLMEYFEVKK